MEVGRSVQRRLIHGEWIGEVSATPPVLVFGAIHGDEPDSAHFCNALIEHVQIRQRCCVIPVLNPDGLAIGAKNNANNVDLNRNFPSENWIATHRHGYFPGNAPGSEPETAALIALIDRIAPASIIAVHQPFACVNWDGPAEPFAQSLAVALGYPCVASIGYPTPGSFGSAYGIDRGVPVITLELGVAPEPRQRILDAAMAFATVVNDHRLG